MTLDSQGASGAPALLIKEIAQCPRCDGLDIRPLRRITPAHAAWSVCDSCGHVWLTSHTGSNRRHVDLYGRL
jgi:hypothetical protein